MKLVVYLLCGIIVTFLAEMTLASPSAIPSKLNQKVIDFDLNQNHYFDALVRMSQLPEGESSEETSKRAMALNGFGLHKSADSLYEKLAGTKNTEASAANYYLGLAKYEKGQWKQALTYFSKANTRSAFDLKGKINFYRANTFIKLDRQQEAADTLGKMKAGLWAAYGYYNLGVSYVGSDSDPSRAIIALRVSEALNPSDDKQSKDLKDQAIFTAGYLALQSEDPDKALSFLNRIQVESASAPKALYSKGLAHSELEDYRSAIQAWYRVKKYPLVKPGVAETFLAIPFAYDKLGYVGKAATSYLESVSVFDKEIVTLNKVITAVKKIGARNALVGKSSLDDIEWFLSDSIATNTPKVAYLGFLMESPEIYGDVEQLAEIALLRENLERWKRDLSVFKKMLKVQIKQYKQRVSLSTAGKSISQLSSMNAQLSDLMNQLNTAQKTKDFLAVRAGSTLSKYAKIQKLKKKINELKNAGEDVSDMEERVIRLESMVMFEAAKRFDGNLSLSKESLSELRDYVSKFQKNANEFERKSSAGPRHLNDFLKQVNAKSKTVKQKLATVKKLQTKMDINLNLLVLDKLEAQKKSYKTFHEQAQQSLAHIYERIALQQYQKVQDRLKKEALRKQRALGVRSPRKTNAKENK